VGKLALSPDGALEGTVHEILTGHSAYERRVDFEGNAATRQADQVKEAILAIYPTAEVNDIKVENVNDPEKPLRVEYHIKIPGYGQRTGKRIFFQPFFFERGKAPMFTESKRLYDIFFHYAWEELDNVRIALPPGFELENSEKPGPLDFGKAGSYSVHMTVEDKTTLSCSRQFTFGNEHRLLYARVSYNQMKDVFDDIQRRDSHTMALKQIAETPKPAAVTGN
jgi:hypothetical protein